MPNMNLKKTECRHLDPNIRNKNFEEVSLGYNEEEALEEASRCLNCKNPKCVLSCPVNINIPGFISLIREQKYEDAYRLIKESSFLPSICGRVCPQESQCEGACVRGIKGESVSIGRLERFVADFCANIDEENDIKENGKKVAIVGSGPSGLTCAANLRKKGYDVTIFEALHEAGGVLTYGIPEFRLPKVIVKKEVQKLEQMGVKIMLNTVIGKTILIDELRRDFDAIYIASGAGLPRFMNIPGENLNGVYSANEFLTRINLMKSYQKGSSTPIIVGSDVVVVGGGNVAMDACRAAKRLGAKNVYIVYRRSMDELPARKEEVMHAQEEGIIFNLLTNPVSIIGSDNFFVSEIECIKMELGEPDQSGRRSPVEIQGSNFRIKADTVIMALGTSPNPLIKNTTKDLEFNKRGCIVTDSEGRTNIKGIYAGGDCNTGAATVILAMGAGLKAANAIDIDLNK